MKDSQVQDRTLSSAKGTEIGSPFLLGKDSNFDTVDLEKKHRSIQSCTKSTGHEGSRAISP